eukprot:3307972-Prymnesium_polylepis.1
MSNRSASVSQSRRCAGACAPRMWFGCAATRARPPASSHRTSLSVCFLSPPPAPSYTQVLYTVRALLLMHRARGRRFCVWRPAAANG